MSEMVLCARLECSTEAEAVLVVAKRVLRGPWGESVWGFIPVKRRVIGWFHYDGHLYCSLYCYIEALDGEHFGHYNGCNACNYDKDCITCDVDDGTMGALSHACNCPEGLGLERMSHDGWGYYRRKLIERLRRKWESREAKFWSKELHSTADSD